MTNGSGPNAARAEGHDERAYRQSAIDMVRGLAIVVMAIDHVRDFFLAGAVQDPMADPDIGASLFATRWITHYCAPTFVCLAGVSAGLMTARKTQAELGAFLLKRGAWLIAVEWFVISTAFTFAPFGMPEMGGLVLIPLQVIWAIGASMVALAAAQFLGRRACLAIGIAIIVGHNALDGHWPSGQSVDNQVVPYWVSLHAQMGRVVGPYRIAFAYPLLPWIGVMLFGFGGSRVFELPSAARDSRLKRLGAIFTAAFVALRLFDVYGDANHWQLQPGGLASTIFDFLNTTKYPPSLSFLLMTLGPTTILCGFADQLRGRMKDTLVMFGRVPFAFYVAHFYLIHALTIALGVTQGFRAGQFFRIFFFYPKGYGVPLWGVYVVWALVIVMLYPFCKWVAGVKARRRDWWLSYL